MGRAALAALPLLLAAGASQRPPRELGDVRWIERRAAGRRARKAGRELSTIAILLLVATGGAVAAPLDDLLSRDSEKVEAAFDAIEQSGDVRDAAALIELLRASGSPRASARIAEILAELTGEDLGSDWGPWVEWYASTPVHDPDGFIAWKGKLLSRIDPKFGEILQDGAPSRMRVGEVIWGGVAYEGIPALDSPSRVSAQDADYLKDEDPVFGIVLGGEARAYPLRILDWHEMVNDQVGGVPFTLAYCTLCGSGIAYDTRIAGGQGGHRSFGSSGLLMRSNKLMVDRETRTLWNQFTGRPVLGPLAADEDLVLRKVPSVVTTWGEWKRRHPESSVVGPETGFERDYRPGAAYADYFASPRTMFPVLEPGGPIAAKERVFGLEHQNARRAWSLASLREQGVTQGEVGPLEVVILTGEPIPVTGRSARTRAVYSYDAGSAVRAYESQGRHFEAAGKDQLRDDGGGLWRVTEGALVGPAGERLARVPGVLSYWFAWSAFYGPDDLVVPGEPAKSP